MLCPAKPAAPNITDNATGLEAQQPNGATATGGSNGHGKPSPPTEHNTATYAQASTVNLIASTRSIGFAITTSDDVPRMQLEERSHQRQATRRGRPTGRGRGPRRMTNTPARPQPPQNTHSKAEAGG